MRIISLVPEGRLPEDVRRWSGCGAQGPGATRSFGRPGHRPAPAGFRGLPLWTCWTWTGRETGDGNLPSAELVEIPAQAPGLGQGPCGTGPDPAFANRARKNGARLKTPRWSADRRPAFSKSNAGRADGPRCKPWFWSRGSQNDAPLGALPPSRGERTDEGWPGTQLHRAAERWPHRLFDDVNCNLLHGA